MLRKINKVIVFDIEFVNSKKIIQPIQIAFESFEYNNNKLYKLDDLNLYIKLLNNHHVPYRVSQYTNITNEKLESIGLDFDKARLNILSYLDRFNKTDTILVGWDITNDLMMFDILFNSDNEQIDINSFRWLDLSKIYKEIKSSKNSISLVKACLDYNLTTDHFHNAYDDSEMTSILLSNLLKDYGSRKVLYRSNTRFKYKWKKLRLRNRIEKV